MAHKVETYSSAFAQIRDLLLNLQPDGRGSAPRGDSATRGSPCWMQEAGSYGLDRMAPVNPTIASLIVSPDEALRPDAHYPRPQCRLTDDLLVRAYNIAARVGQIGNSFSHLILALAYLRSCRNLV